VGQAVGDGECWAFVYEALNAAGAKRPGQEYMELYQFGWRVYGLFNIQPGDVLQFENVNFKHTNPDGSWSSSSFPHHTAIVAHVTYRFGGMRITLLHQNVGGNRTVLQSAIYLRDRQPGGTIRAYRPVPR